MPWQPKRDGNAKRSKAESHPIESIGELSSSIYGNHLIPGYAAVLAGNLVAGCSALIDYAGEYALDVSDLVQRLGQRGWLEPSILLLLPAPLQSVQQVVASCWSIPLQAKAALSPVDSPETASKSPIIVLNDTEYRLP